MKTEKTCQQRIKGELQDRLDDLRKLWSAYLQGEENTEDLGSIYDYGLGFDYGGRGASKFWNDRTVFID